ncbi:MAG: LysE family translocator, partial [Desulfurococcaceae archaeon]|nr:LysE family translocator [Desulfurococcaceae archaeon]
RGGWRAGFQVALGHTLFELPYVVLLTTLYANLINLLELPVVKYLLTTTVVIFCFFFAYLLINDAVSIGGSRERLGNTKFSNIRNPLLIGIILTGLNPFFLIWWATIGLPLIEGVYRYGVVLGLVIMYSSHVWMDYIWLSLLAYTSSKGVKYLSLKGYKILLIILALVLVVFAINTMFKTFLNIPIIPL